MAAGDDTSLDRLPASVAPDPLARSVLWAPRGALASCVRAHIVRDTRRAALAPAQRFNQFPASPMGALTWFFEGEAVVVRRGDEAVHEPVPRVAVGGPLTRPMVSVNPGPVHALMVVVNPQALALLTGADAATLIDRFGPLDAYFGAEWQALSQRMLDCGDERVALQLLEDFLEPRWRPLAARAVPRWERYRHWVEGLALRAAATGVGPSLRQGERRVRQWAGLPLRDLRRLARAEQAFVLVRSAHEQGVVDWADLAAAAGYADQSHLCRDTRRMTGHTPNELRHLVYADEAFWPYRLWE